MSHYLGVLLWTEVVCSGCANTIAGEFVRHGRRQMRMVKAEMDKNGWVNVDGNAYCPSCQATGNAPDSAALILPTPFKGSR